MPTVRRDADPATEARAVSAAMVANGFAGAAATALSSVAQYVAFAGWAEARRVSVGTMAQSQTAFVSVALDADELIAAKDVAVTGFESVGKGSWRMDLALPGCDPSRVLVPILEVAVGAIFAEAPQGPYSADGRATSVSAGPDSVSLTFAPPDGLPACCPPVSCEV